MNREQRKKRVRAKVAGSAQKPRISVYRSLRGMYVQAIDDAAAKTLASVYWKEVVKTAKKNDVERAKAMGMLLAKKCAEQKITTAVFDRNGYQYHGKVQAVADGVREGGLQI